MPNLEGACLNQKWRFLGEKKQKKTTTGRARARAGPMGPGPWAQGPSELIIKGPYTVFMWSYTIFWWNYTVFVKFMYFFKKRPKFWEKKRKKNMPNLEGACLNQKWLFLGKKKTTTVRAHGPIGAQWAPLGPMGPIWAHIFLEIPI